MTGLRPLFVVLLLMQLPSHTPRPEDNPMLWLFHSGQAILESGFTFWDSLKNYQAVTTLRDIQTISRKNASQKHNLSLAIQSNAIKSSRQLHDRLDPIKKSEQSLENELHKFGREISFANQDPDNQDMNNASNGFLSAKMQLIQFIEDRWKLNDTALQKDAAKAAEEASVCSKQITILASCIITTIQEKQRAPQANCSKDYLTKAGKDCSDVSLGISPPR